MTDPAPYLNAMTAAGLPVTGISVAADGVTVALSWANGLPTAQQTAGNQSAASAILADPANGPRSRRALYLIFNDLKALSPANKTAVWNDLKAGTPAKYLLDQGINAGAISAHYSMLVNFTPLSTNATAVVDAEMLLTACYVQDNFLYLVNPSFAPTVNIRGDVAG